MKTIIDRYLDRVLVYANKPETETEALRQELKDHLLQKVDDLIKGGCPREEATLEALRQHGSPKVIGYRLRGAFPWIDIRSHGTARGVIAIGPRAVGIFAFGGVAIGVVACGGVAVGLFSAGGLALGLLLAWGGLSVGGIASGGMAMGLVAAGGLAVGLIAQGGLAIALLVPGPGHAGEAISYYTMQNAPAFLLRLNDGVSSSLTSFGRWIPVLIPFYILGVMGLSLLQCRERKRVSAEDDWLIDG